MAQRILLLLLLFASPAFATTTIQSNDQSITINSLNAPLPITNIHIKFHFIFQNQHLGIHLSGLDADVAGGKIDVKPVDLFLNQTNKLTLKLSNLDLQTINKALDLHNFSINGHLDGILPMTFAGSDIQSIKNGRLYTTGPGVLRYDAKDLSKQYRQLKLISQALANFHYSAITATMNYTHGGEFVMIAQLKGANPDLYAGHEIHFNLNLTGPLTSLIKGSLVGEKLKQEITQKIESYKQ